MKNYDEIKLLLMETNLDILLIVETWLKDVVPDSMIQIEGYNILRSDRDLNSGKQTGGGVCLYIKQNINYKQLDNLITCTPSLESIWLKIKIPKTRRWVIGGIYRPPDGPESTFLEELESNLISIINELVHLYFFS